MVLHIFHAHLIINWNENEIERMTKRERERERERENDKERERERESKGERKKKRHGIFMSRRQRVAMLIGQDRDQSGVWWRLTLQDEGLSSGLLVVDTLSMTRVLLILRHLPVGALFTWLIACWSYHYWRVHVVEIDDAAAATNLTSPTDRYGESNTLIQ